jgi:hypothetical protein
MTDSPMHPSDPTRRDPGRWCEQHQRYECTKRGKHGGACHGSRIAGTPACRMHAGVVGKLAKVKGEAVTAWSALTGTASIVPAEAVLGMLQMSWFRVHVYAELLEQQVAEAQTRGHVDGGLDLQDDLDDEEPRARGAASVGPGVGLVGHTFSGVKDIGIFATGEAIRGLTQLEAAERDRCVKYAKTAHDMGIADRQIKLAEEQGALLAGVIGRILDALELTAKQRELVSVVVPRELRAAAGGDAA